MQDFAFYFEMGWQHILSWDAMDHILFVLVLTVIYLLENWKQVLILVTAFTIGHSITLALSAYDIIKVNTVWIEFLIPFTILATAVFNFRLKDYGKGALKLNYFFALFFGLIHGLGFANTLRFMLADDQSLGWSLFPFNLGLEAGQLVLVALILGMSYIVVNRAKLKRKWWVWSLSGLAICLSAKMIWERWPA